MLNSTQCTIAVGDRDGRMNSITFSSSSFDMTEAPAPGACMRAEIFEQPAVLRQLAERAADALTPVAQRARECVFAVLTARGSSDNASIYGKYLLEGRAGMPTALAAPSLYTLYSTPPRLRDALVVGVSQSGAAADVIAVLEEGRRQGAVTLAITNTAASPITHAAEYVLLLGAGPERALAATKTVTAQCAAYVALVASIASDTALRQALHDLSDDVRRVFAEEQAIAEAAASFCGNKRVVVIGRGYTYGAAMEIALKLKETSFIGAEAYSAADFLHGPLAIIEPGYPVIALLNHDETMEMTLQVMQQILQRGGRVLCFSTVQAAGHLPDHPALVVLSPVEAPSLLSAIPFIVAGQLFALHLSLRLGYNPDISRGLTKVTVTR